MTTPTPKSIGTSLSNSSCPASSGLHCSSRRKRAFTLVEVTIALGIVAFALVGLIGAIPVGLNAAQISIQQTAQTHILKQVSSDLGMLSFNNLSTYVSATQYCDYDGRRLDGPANAIYEVSMKLSTPAYPHSDQIANLSNRMETVIVSIRRVGEAAALTVQTPLSVTNTGL